MTKKIEDYLHLYLGCEMFVFTTESITDGFLNRYKERYPEGQYKYTLTIENFSKTLKDGYLPVLRPLPDMTEEEENVVAMLCFGDREFKIGYRGMGYFIQNHTIHESVRCVRLDTYCNHPSINEWLPAALLQIDFQDDSMPIIIGRFSEQGTKLKDDLIDRPFELTRYLLSKHFDLFGLIEAGLAIDKTKIAV